MPLPKNTTKCPTCGQPTLHWSEKLSVVVGLALLITYLVGVFYVREMFSILEN